MHLYFDVFFYKPDRHDIGTISMYMNLLYTRGGYWLPAFSHLSGQQIKAATSSGFGPRRAWDFFVLEALEDGTPLAFNLLNLFLGCLEKTLIQIYSEVRRSLCAAKDAVNCTNSREERPYEYIAGFKASWAGSLYPVDVDDCPVDQEGNGQMKISM